MEREYENENWWVRTIGCMCLKLVSLSLLRWLIAVCEVEDEIQVFVLVFFFFFSSF